MVRASRVHHGIKSIFGIKTNREDRTGPPSRSRETYISATDSEAAPTTTPHVRARRASSLDFSETIYYKYKPLDAKNKEVRLLEVQPVEEDFLPLRCSIQHASLNSDPAPAYETISYVWGNPNTKEFIEIDGTEYSFPASSAAAIRRMRLPNRSRILWIDAICINQNDLDERAKQVAMMGDVYRNSKGNLIYLGRGNNATTSFALMDIKTILQEMNEETQGLTVVKNTVFDPLAEDSERKYAETGLRFPLNDKRLVDCIFGLPWFT